MHKILFSEHIKVCQEAESPETPPFVMKNQRNQDTDGAYRDTVREEPVQVCLGDDEAVLALGLGRHLLLPQPLSLLASHRASTSTSWRRGRSAGTAWKNPEVLVSLECASAFWNIYSLVCFNVICNLSGKLFSKSDKRNLLTAAQWEFIKYIKTDRDATKVFRKYSNTIYTSIEIFAHE